MDISPLVGRLIEVQTQRGQSDRQFAAALGVDWSYWSYVRKGKRAAGRKLIEGACRAFPEVRVLVGQECGIPHDAVGITPLIEAAS